MNKYSFKFLRIFVSLFLFCFLYASTLTAQVVNHWETAVFTSDTWRYFPGTSAPPATWNLSTFVDTSWKTGTGSLGFGGWENTTVTTANSLYMRYKFAATDTSKIARAILSMNYNDAFVAYLNGVEIARSGITGNPPAYTQTGTYHPANADLWMGTLYYGQMETFFVEKAALKSCIKQGDNVLAIQIHNSVTGSTDMLVDAFLSFGITNTSKFFRTTPSWFSVPVTFTSSNLPIIKITTDNNQTIPTSSKILGNMKVVYKEGAAQNLYTDMPVLDARIGVKVHGSSSASYPQQSLRLETRLDDVLNMDTVIFGMPRDNDWLLITNWNDKSFSRNTLSYDIFRKMGHYAPRMRHCEVTVNGEYKGVYLFGEKIKRGKGRVDIANLKTTDLAGDSLTGGYIFKTDYDDGYGTYWSSKFSPLNRPGAEVRFVFVEPDAVTIAPEQSSYIASYVNQLETALYATNFKDPITGYRAYLDVNSFIDYWILEELARNVDGYKKSRYFYKDKDSNNKLVCSGPSWDFDWAWKNLNDCDLLRNTTGAGWAYKINECSGGVSPTPPSWEVRLLQDPAFANAVNARYFDLRKTVLSTAYINHHIDSIATLLTDAQVRHFAKFKTLGTNNGAPEIDQIPTTFSGEMTKLKSWINTRLTWLDANMVGTRTATPQLNAEFRLRIFPNPVKEKLYVESDHDIVSITVCNAVGNAVLSSGPLSSEQSLNVEALPKGIYVIRVRFRDGNSASQKLVKE